MAHYATNRFNYWGQLGILAAFTGAGLIIGGLVSYIPLSGKMSVHEFFSKDALEKINKLLIPENASIFRTIQFISTLFLFFLPPVLYAKICHMKPFRHLGFSNGLSTKPWDIQTTTLQAGMIILIMLVSLPAVSALQDLTELLPWSKTTLLQFKEAENEYNKQVAAIARMDNIADYIISVIVIALLPAVFEETLFRGGIQNLLSRWFKMPILAIVLTAIVFSAVHGSYLGFLSRFALGFVLGWVYYRTGNIWLNIIAHFFNNAMAVTSLYLSTGTGEKVDPSKMEEHFPLWQGLASIAAVVWLLFLFDRISKKTIDRPGEEVLVPGYQFSNNPFENDTAHTDQS